MYRYLEVREEFFVNPWGSITGSGIQNAVDFQMGTLVGYYVKEKCFIYINI